MLLIYYYFHLPNMITQIKESNTDFVWYFIMLQEKYGFLLQDLTTGKIVTELIEYQYEIRTIFDLLVQYHILNVEFEHLNNIPYIYPKYEKKTNNLNIETYQQDKTHIFLIYKNLLYLFSHII